MIEILTVGTLLSRLAWTTGNRVSKGSGDMWRYRNARNILSMVSRNIEGVVLRHQRHMCDKMGFTRRPETQHSSRLH